MEPEEAARVILNKLSRNPRLKERKRRELFISHFCALFPDYAWQIYEYAVGAEDSVKIKAKTGEETVTGQIDTRKGALLVEYKRDLTKNAQINEAEDQLKDYVAGIVNEEGSDAVNKCLATDILRWREYEVKISERSIEGEVESSDIDLELLRSYEFNLSKVSDFVNTTRRLILEDVPFVATGDLLAERYGLGSSHYQEFTSKLKEVWSDRENTPKAQLGLELWSKYIENCFEKDAEVDKDTYLNHVYLVILARMIAGSAIGETSEQALDKFPLRCIRGDFFSSGTHRVDRFVEEDFFRWIKDEEVIEKVKPVLSKLHFDLQRLDFRSAEKLDLLQDLYQQIMPPEHRIKYGAVFTPTGLVEGITSEFDSIGKIGEKVLDPACGTGSFLRAVIRKKLENIPEDWSPQKVLDSVLGDVTGLDINPVSVIIAKTTIILILADFLKKSDKPVEIPIYLCDSLFLPEELVHEDEDKVTVIFDGSPINFPSKLFEKGPSEFDEIVQTSERLANQVVKKSISFSESEEVLRNKIDSIAKKLECSSLDRDKLQEGSRHLVTELVRRIQDKRNRVWAFVLENTYRPSFLKAKFDVIISNPPWLAMSSFPAASYKKRLEKGIENYKLAPFGSSRHHMEISTLFAVHCVNHYMKEGGRFAFNLPRAILSGDQHDPFRLSKFKEESPMSVSYIWDLEEVAPLFKRPACVVFGKRDDANAGVPKKLPRVKFSGSPDSLRVEEKSSLRLKTFGSKSAFASEEEEEYTAVSFYDEFFYEGADLMPRCAVMVDIEGSKDARVLSIQTSSIEKANPRNKPPYNELDFRGTIERDYIYTTLKSTSLLPFVIGPFSYAALPVEKSGEEFRIVDSREMTLKGHDRARQWFEKVNKKLMKVADKRLESWLKRRNKLIDQSAKGCEYTVLYGAGGKNVAATVVDTTQTNFPFVNDQTLYAWKASNENEAWYVCGILNSQPVNKAIKSLQAKGDFGPQHVHKLPLYLIPKFDERNPDHLKVVDEAKRLARIGKRLCEDNPDFMNFGKSLHSRRKEYRKELEPKMKEINRLSKRILPYEEG